MWKYDILKNITNDGVIEVEEQYSFILKAREIALNSATQDINIQPQGGKNSQEDIESYNYMADASLYFGTTKKQKRGKLNLDSKITNHEKDAKATARRMLRLVDERKLNKIISYGAENIVLSENNNLPPKNTAVDFDIIPELKNIKINENLKNSKLFKVFVASILTAASDEDKKLENWIKNNELTPETMAEAINIIRDRNISLKGYHKDPNVKVSDQDRYLGEENGIKNNAKGKMAFDLLNSVDKEFDFYNWYGKNKKDQYITRKKQILGNKRDAEKASRVMLKDFDKDKISKLLEEAIKLIEIKKEETKAPSDKENTNGNGTTTTADKENANGNGTTTTTDKENANGNGTTTTADKENANGNGITTTADKENANGNGTTTTADKENANGNDTTTTADKAQNVSRNKISSPSEKTTGSQTTSSEKRKDENKETSSKTVSNAKTHPTNDNASTSPLKTKEMREDNIPTTEENNNSSNNDTGKFGVAGDGESYNKNLKNDKYKSINPNCNDNNTESVDSSSEQNPNEQVNSQLEKQFSDEYSSSQTQQTMRTPPKFKKSQAQATINPQLQNQMQEQVKAQLSNIVPPLPQPDIDILNVGEIAGIQNNEQETEAQNDLLPNLASSFDELAKKEEEENRLAQQFNDEYSKSEPQQPMKTPPMFQQKQANITPPQIQPNTVVPPLPQPDIDIPNVGEIAGIQNNEQEPEEQNDLLPELASTFDEMAKNNKEKSLAGDNKVKDQEQPLVKENNKEQSNQEIVGNSTQKPLPLSTPPIRTRTFMDGAYSINEYSQPAPITDIGLEIPKIAGLNLDSQKVVSVSDYNGRTLSLENGDTLNINGDVATFGVNNGSRDYEYVYTRHNDGSYHLESISEKTHNSPIITTRNGHFSPVHCMSLLGKENISKKEVVQKGLTMMPHAMATIDKDTFGKQLTSYNSLLQTQFNQLIDPNKVKSCEVNYDGSYAVETENGDKVYIYQNPETGNSSITQTKNGKITQQFKINGNSGYSLNEYIYDDNNAISKVFTKGNTVQYYTLDDKGWRRVDAPAAVEICRISEAISNGKSIDSVYRTLYPMEKSELEKAMKKYTIEDSILDWGETSLDIFKENYQVYLEKGGVHHIKTPLAPEVVASALATYPEKSKEFQFAISCIDSKEKLDYVNQILSKGLSINGQVINTNALASKVLKAKNPVLIAQLARYDTYFAHLYNSYKKK